MHMKLRVVNLPMADKSVEYPFTFPEKIRKFTLRLRSGNDLRIAHAVDGTDDDKVFATIPGGAQNFDNGEVSGKVYVRSPDADNDTLELLYYRAGI